MIQTIRWENYNRIRELASPFLRGSKERPLRITLHSASLKTLTGEAAEATDLIREFSHLDELKVIETEPTSCPYIEIGNYDSTLGYIPVQLINNGQIEMWTSISQGEQLSQTAKILARQNDIQHPDAKGMLDALTIGLAHCQVGGDILVTTSKHLLDHRDDSLIATMNPRTPLETTQILGLFLRSRGNFVYKVVDNIRLPFNRHLFYWVLARHKLPGMWRYFSACVHASKVHGDDLLMLGQSILERAVRALQARDAIGIAFYGGTGEQEEMMYHFDYLPLLLTGAIDAQARVANRAYKVARNERTISFYELKRDKKFQQQLEAKGAVKLSEFIAQDRIQRLLCILYETRNVIHGAAMHPISYRDGASGISTLVQLPDAITDCVQESVQSLGGIQEWGLKENGNARLQLVEPFSFATTLVVQILNTIDTIAQVTEVERLLTAGQLDDLASAEPQSKSPFEWGKRLALLG
jgi:hypothetical protein